MSRPPGLERYRRTGADLPFGDPGRAHGVSMEGYYWRFTDAAAGRVVVALIGVSRAADGPWALVALAGHPGGFLRRVVTRTAWADPVRLGAGADAVFAGDDDRLRVDLGPGARLDVRFRDAVRWPRRALGGLGPAQAVPALGQYWHPHLLGARVEGGAQLGRRRLDLGQATAYGEKNWGGTFPGEWWWGQAQGFDDEDVCVAFAGGRLRRGPVRLAPTSLVVRLGGDLIQQAVPLAVVSADVGEGSWRLRGRSLGRVVDIEADGGGLPPHLLPVPLPSERRAEDRAAQHLAGRMSLVVKEARRIRYRGESALAGLEHGTPFASG